MFSLRSAQGRAILASALLILVLAAVASAAILRVRQHQQRLLALEDTAAAVASLEHARAQFFLEAAATAALVFVQDPVLAERAQLAAAELEYDLSEARARIVASGNTGNLATLDSLIERIEAIGAQVEAGLPFLLAGDQEAILALATATWPELWPTIDTTMNDLETLADAQRNELVAARAEADRAARVTSWIVVGFGGGALLVAAGLTILTIASVVRPLASLRASARAIASGDLEARARLSGPEEVVSLARDFNEMTDALAAKTKEYIDTTNLTGDMIARLDRRGNWAFLNDAACQFYGKPRGELLGTDSRAAVHPEDVEATAQSIRAIRVTGQPLTGFVNRQMTPVGIRVVEWNGHPLFDEEGKYAGIQITGRDITERKRMEEALRESEQRYRLLAENATDLIWTTDLNLRYTYVSPSVALMRGYSPEELVGKSVAETLTPHSLELARKVFAQEGAAEEKGERDPHESRTLELEIYCKDGSTIWTEAVVTPLRDSDGRLTGVLGVTRDISERKKAEEALRENEERYRLLAENTSDLIWTVDMSLRYTYMSPAITRMRGYTVEEIVGASIAETMTPASLEAARKSVAEELALEARGTADPNRSRSIELEMYCKDGSTIWTELNATFLHNADGKPIGILGVTRDISERKRAQEERDRLHAELEVKAVTDGLTGLYNHAHFYQRLNEEIERSKRYKHGFAVVMMDVNNFKQYNDSRGHQAGDEALQMVAECIRMSLRRSDLAFRYGGDEFAAILPHAGSSKARAVVERINGRIAKALQKMDDGAGVRLSLSCGVARFPDDGTTADDLVRIADAALYSAKRAAPAGNIGAQTENPSLPIPS